MVSLKWGLIGAGDIARKRVAPALRDLPNCDLVSVSRFRSAQAESFANEFGARRWYGDWREQIADDDIDAVYIATPVYLHAEQTIAAAEAGKHVLCEKPMALSVNECDEMIAACQANNVKLGIAYYRRFYPALIRTKEIITSDEIGKVSVAQINAFEFFDPPADDSRRWLLDKEKSGGGPLMDFGCHRLEVLTNLFGPIERVEGLTSKSTFGREVEDTAATVFRFENGCIATIIVTHAACEPRDSLEIFGTRGSIHIPALNNEEMSVVSDGAIRSERHPAAANLHGPLIDDFTDAVLNDREPAITGDIGRQVNTAIEQVYNRGV